MKGHIYLIVNVLNNKMYVGKTYDTIEIRWKHHLRDSRKRKFDGRPLYKAIYKYGAESFEVLQLGEFEEGELEKQEVYFIGLFDTYRNGYNATIGGDGAKIYTFTKEDIEEAVKGTSSIKEAAKKLRIDSSTIKKYAKAYNIKLPTFGKLHGRAEVTEEQAYRIKYGNEKSKILQREFGVSKFVISRIRMGKSWNTI